MERAKKVFIIIGCIVLFLFLAPIVGGMLNIGNLFGIAAGGVLLTIGLRFEKVSGLVKRIYQKESGKIFLNTFFPCLLLVCCVFVLHSARLSVPLLPTQNTKKQSLFWAVPWLEKNPV